MVNGSKLLLKSLLVKDRGEAAGKSSLTVVRQALGNGSSNSANEKEKLTNPYMCH